MKTPKPLISFFDYQRLHRVIATVLNSVDAHTAHACLFFSVAGSLVLSKAHGLDARPWCGSAFYRVNDEDGFTMAFTDTSRFSDGYVESHDKAFHAWIECEGMVIDLMAPLFRESVLSSQPTTEQRLPRKMFQKPLSMMSASPFELVQEGDFFLQADPVLTNELLQHFMKKHASSDLANICLHWYKPTPKPIPSELGMGSDDGTQRLMKLEQTELTGKW